MQGGGGSFTHSLGKKSVKLPHAKGPRQNGNRQNAQPAKASHWLHNSRSILGILLACHTPLVYLSPTMFGQTNALLITNHTGTPRQGT